MPISGRVKRPIFIVVCACRMTRTGIFLNRIQQISAGNVIGFSLCHLEVLADGFLKIGMSGFKQVIWQCFQDSQRAFLGLRDDFSLRIVSLAIRLQGLIDLVETRFNGWRLMLWL